MKNKLNVKSEKLKVNRGFTLVEMMVAIGLFALIASFALGAVLTIFDSSARARASKTLVDNLNLTMEDIARTVRFGSSFHCSLSTLPLSDPRNCNSGAPTDNGLAVQFQGKQMVYRQNNTSIQVSNDGGITYRDLTDPNVVVEYLRFYVFGTSKSDTVQPYVVVVIRGHMGNKPTTQSNFTIETVLTQRKLDL